jgi:hypothetical protein
VAEEPHEGFSQGHHFDEETRGENGDYGGGTCYLLEEAGDWL